MSDIIALGEKIKVKENAHSKTCYNATVVKFLEHNYTKVKWDYECFSEVIIPKVHGIFINDSYLEIKRTHVHKYYGIDKSCIFVL